MQLISLISSLSGIYIGTYNPQISQLRILGKNNSIKDLYLRGQIIFATTYILGSFILLIFGSLILNIIKSKTMLMEQSIMFLALIITFLECNHSIAGGILLTKNEVPFFKASITAGLLTILFLLIFFQIKNIGIIAMVLSPGIAHLYNNWKWPKEVFMQLNITTEDVKYSIKKLLTNISHFKK